MPQFLHLRNGNNTSTYFILMAVNIETLRVVPENSKHSINVNNFCYILTYVRCLMSSELINSTSTIAYVISIWAYIEGPLGFEIEENGCF